MIAYTCVGSNDLTKSIPFYEALFAIVGAKVLFRSEQGAGFGVAPDKPMFTVLTPFDKQPAGVGNGSMVSIAAADPAQVRALHAKALELGAADEGAPGPRGAGAFYACYFRDLDGNKLGAMCMA